MSADELPTLKGVSATDGETATDLEATGPISIPEIIPASGSWDVGDDVDEAAKSTTAQSQSLPRPAAHAAPPTTQPPTAQQPAVRAESTQQVPVDDKWGVAVEPSIAQVPQLRTAGRRPRVRKVTRVVRHIDPWSAFKVGFILSLALYLVVLTSGVLLWRVAEGTGTLANIERWFTQFGWETFEFNGDAIFSNAWIIGLFLAIASTGLFVLLASLFNLISDIVGGIRVTVLEEEVVERTASARRYVVRRSTLPAPVESLDSSWSVDD